MSKISVKDGKPTVKKSTRETGNAINLSNFALLIKTVARFKGNYNPSNPDITVKALEELYNKAKAQLDGCTTAETVFDNATGSRSELFKNMKVLSAKAHRSFKASKAPETAKKDAQTIMNKLNGNASKAKKKEILVENEEAKKTISNSQRSFTQLIEHFKGLRELVSSHEAYKPNEAELKPDVLFAFEKQLNDENSNVGNAITNWRSIRRNRNKTFYGTDAGLVNTALTVKDYVASIFGSTTPEFQEVRKIKFRNF